MNEEQRKARIQELLSGSRKEMPAYTTNKVDNSSWLSEIEGETTSQAPIKNVQKEYGLLESIARAPVNTLSLLGQRTTEAIGRTGVLGKDIKKGYEAFADEGGQNISTIAGDYNIPTATGAKQIAGEALDATSYLVPVGRIAGGAGKVISKVAPKLGKGALKVAGNVVGGATAGYTQDVSQGLMSDQSVPESLIPGIGTLTGGSIPLAVAGISKVAKGVSSLSQSVKNQVSPNAVSGVMQALKVGKRAREFEPIVKDVLPVIDNYTKTTGTPINSLEELSIATKNIKKDLWSQIDEAQKSNNIAGVTIDTKSIASDIASSISDRTRLQNPSLVEKITKVADSYWNTKLTPSQAEDFLQEINAELNTYYAKNNIRKAVDIKDPEVLYKIKEAEGLRKVLNNTIESYTGTDYGDIKKTYGKLSQFGTKVDERASVVGGQSPFSLAEQFSYADALASGGASVATGSPIPAIASLGRVALARFMKNANMPDNLIKDSLEKFSKAQTPKEKSSIIQKLTKRYPKLNDAFKTGEFIDKNQAGQILKQSVISGTKEKTK